MNTHSQARPLRLALALLIGAGLGCGRTQPLPRVDLLRSSVTVDRSSGLVADGADAVTITVKLVDVDGKIAAGRRVGLSATGAGNVFDPPSAISDETGTVISRLSSVRAELKTLTATLDPDTRPQPLSEQPSVSFVAGAVDPSSSTIEVNPSTLIADGAAYATITVKLRDAHGNPTPGHAVELSATGEGGLLIQPVATADENGATTGALASTRTGRKEITATVDPGSPAQAILVPRPAIDFVPGPPSATTSTVGASPSSVLADGFTTTTVTVTLRDALGNPVTGLPVALQASGSSNLIGQPTTVTDALGVTTGTVASTRAEVKTLTAIAKPGPEQVVLAQQPTVTFRPGAPSIFGITLDVSPRAVVADGVSSARLTVTVRDVSNNPVPGQAVQLAVTGSSNVLVQPAGLTGTDGVATGSVTSTRAEIKAVTAVINPGPGQITTAPQLVLFIPGPPSAITSSLVANPVQVLADGTSRSTLTVTVADAYGNPVPFQQVALSSTGSGNILIQPAVDTDLGGVATGSLASTRVGLKTVTAVINPGPSQITVAQQATVSFFPGPPSASASTVTALPATVAADGVSTSLVTVTVVDAFGNPLSGQLVTLSATGTRNFITQPPAPTNAAGVTTGTLASTRAEVKTVTATVNPTGPSPVVLAQRPTVTFTPGPPSAADSSVTASPLLVTADGSSITTVTVVVRDTRGNPIPGLPVQLAATGSGNVLVQPGPTDFAGTTTGTLASTRAELKTLTATINPGPGQLVLPQQPVVAFVPGPPSDTVSTVTARPTTVRADGAATSLITVTVLDANGNPIPGQTVQLAATGSRNTFVQPGPTDASGVATGTLASTKAEVKTITATVNPTGPSPVVLAQQPTVTFVPGPPSATASTVTANPTSVIADGVATSTITVTVMDAQGNPVPGQTVQLAATGGGNTLVQPAGPTDASGVAQGTIASTTLGLKTLTARVNPGPGQVVVAQTAVVSFVPGPPSATASTVNAAPTTVVANGVATSTITVTVVDSVGHPLSGVTVALSATGSGNTFVQPGPTNAAGMTTGTLVSTKAEVKTVTATVNPTGPSPVVLAQQPTVTFIPGPPSATASTVTAAPTTVVADGVSTSTITATVMDAQGNPIPGQTVQLAANGTGNTLVQPTGPTNASGVTTGTLASTKAEVKMVTATVNPGASQVVLAQRPTVTFVPGPPSATTSTVVANPTSLPADAVSTSTITVTVKDAQGNLVPGQLVSLAASGSSNTVTQPATPTDAAGVATGTIASGKAEAKQITATVNPGASQVVLAQKPIVTFLAGSPGPVPGTGCTQNSSVAVDPATGRPAIAFYRGSDLWFTECTSNCVLAPVWSTPVRVDAGVISCNRPDAALTLLYLPSGAPAIAYRDLNNCTANYAVRSGTQWNTSVIESVGTSRCNTTLGSISMALAGPSNTPVVAYYSRLASTRGAARFAACLLNCDTGLGVIWGRQNADSIGISVGRYVTVRVDPVTRLPRLAYQDDWSAMSILKYATCADASSTQTCAQGQGNWTAGTVDQIFGVRLGAWASLDLRPDGTPVISYQDETNTTLKVATCSGQCSSASASTWQKTVADLGPSTGKYTFLRIDSGGQARIAYYNTAQSRLLYAVQSGTSTTYAIMSVDNPVTEGQSSFVLAPPGTDFAYANSNGLRYYPTGF